MTGFHLKLSKDLSLLQYQFNREGLHIGGITILSQETFHHNLHAGADAFLEVPVDGSIATDMSDLRNVGWCE